MHSRLPGDDVDSFLFPDWRAVTLRFDVLVAGAGPAGSVAALTLARAGARVALVDKAEFPRDKACGDLVGPRGVRTLADLGFDVSGWPQVGDMVVVGPAGKRVVLRARAGRTYPGHGVIAPRAALDAELRRAALDAGACGITGRVDAPLERTGRLDGFALSSGKAVRADVVVGADGATSRVGEVAGLVDGVRVLWGFAARYYAEVAVNEPHIVLWTPDRGAGLPGYGWVFPSGDGSANVGLGIGTLGRRGDAHRAVRDLDAFVAHAARHRVVRRHAPRRPLGGWLKMGLVGTTPARGNVLLVGDAAGLVNPLQGEGIAQALDSGAAAARAILENTGAADAIYRRHVRRTYASYCATTASVQRLLLTHPALIDAVTRTITAYGIGRAISPAWAIYWNHLVDGAVPTPGAFLASTGGHLGSLLTAGLSTSRSIRASLRDGGGLPGKRGRARYVAGRGEGAAPGAVSF